MVKSTAKTPVAGPGRTLMGLAVERMGQHGEGVATAEGKPVFVPFALPGETVTALPDGQRARLVSIERASRDRVAPFCPHFGRCGGCALQHWAEHAYRDWKRDLVARALRHERVEAPVADLVDAHGGGRRRVKLHMRKLGGQMRAGFMAARTHDLVAIERCPILVPALGEAPAIATGTAEALRTAKPLAAQLTATSSGLDLDLTGSGAIDLAARLRLTDLADRLDLARLTLHGEIVVERRAPSVEIGELAVTLPPGGFLQATSAGEAALAALVAEAVGDASAIADLFAGIGPFALRLAHRARLHAVDSAEPALKALTHAHHRTSGLKALTSESRDLFRRPLLAAELKRFSAVILDPPRAGAEAQMRELAASSVPVIASVSCNAATFARDAAILIGGGFRLDRVTPVDQFKWSPHVEVVGVFRR